jgi:DNA-3-methyladenine glycosylase II
MTSIRAVVNHYEKVDPSLAALITAANLEPLAQTASPDFFFQKLCRDIVGQQLSIKAADTIIGRFEALFPAMTGELPRGIYRHNQEAKHQMTPEFLLRLSDEQLRGVGLSRAKMNSVRDLAERITRHELDLAAVENMSDEEAILHLTQVKGIGPWTTEMFLIFTLGREDVFSWGDLGLRRAIEKNFGEYDQATLGPRVESWKPYRSYASLALWRSLDNG